MAVNVAINGFGRIGRNVLRAIVESGRRDINIVAINDLGPVETNAHLLRFDSVHGRFPGEVKVDGDTIDVGLGPIKVTALRDPAELPHAALGVDIALECTGVFTAKAKASAHLKAGAKRVLVSAPADERGLDRRLWRQPRQARRRSSRRLERLLHHQLPGAGRQGAERCDRHRAWLHDDDPLLYRRPADARHDAQGSLPRPRRGSVDDPDLDRRGQGRRARPAGARRASSTALRSACRRPMSRSSISNSSPSVRPTRKKSTARSSAPPNSETEGHSRLSPMRRMSRSISTTIRIRPFSTRPDQGHRRHVRAHPLLV